MYSLDELKKIGTKLGEGVPEIALVVLYGSYVKGNFKEGKSDHDICIITSEDEFPLKNEELVTRIQSIISQELPNATVKFRQTPLFIGTGSEIIDIDIYGAEHFSLAQTVEGSIPFDIAKKHTILFE